MLRTLNIFTLTFFALASLVSNARSQEQDYSDKSIFTLGMKTLQAACASFSDHRVALSCMNQGLNVLIKAEPFEKLDEICENKTLRKRVPYNSSYRWITTGYVDSKRCIDALDETLNGFTQSLARRAQACRTWYDIRENARGTSQTPNYDAVDQEVMQIIQDLEYEIHFSQDIARAFVDCFYTLKS